MRKTTIGAFVLALFIVPHVAQAQSFKSSFRYTAKFLCGPGENDSNAGVVPGHYNTTINIQAYRSRTAVAYRATALAGTFDLPYGVPTLYSQRFDFDRDEAFGVQCYYVKMLLGVAESQGFVEGYLNIYSSRPLDVVSVVTAEGETGVSTVQMLPAGERSAGETVEPTDFD